MDTSEFVSPGGVLIEPSSITVPAAAGAVLSVTQSGSYAALVECRATEGADIVVLDVEVERPQVPVHDIRAVERIAAVFPRDNGSLPEALALREGFPRVPHLNQRAETRPRSLCLYDRGWTEIKSSWTPASFLERIRWWLASTARGELHGSDQPLEPLMLAGLDLVVPADFGEPGGPCTLAVRVRLVDGEDGRVLVSDDAALPDRGGKGSFVMHIRTPARTHGVIERTPATLADLASLVDIDGFSVLERMRDALRAIPDELRTNRALRRKVWPVFVLALPKKRHDGGEVESVEFKGVLCTDSIENVGASIGAWVIDGDEIAHPLGEVAGADGSDTSVMVVSVVRSLTPERAAMHSGLGSRDARRIVAVGAGALGSQVAMNLARSGFGTWTIIDNDVFMPHNGVRHALHGDFGIGHNKALCMAVSMNSVAHGEVARGIPADFLAPGAYQKLVDDSLGEAELVLDMTASVPVSRALADADLPCRVSSIFLSPNGQDLVMLTEDPDRQVRLDDLEMQYYGDIATREELADHLKADTPWQRYGASCRDVSVVMGQAAVGTLAGVGASAVMQDVACERASSRIWRRNSTDLSVAAYELDVTPFLKTEQHGWRVCVSRRMLEEVQVRRQERLPNETGGILLGGVDHARRCVHVVLALGSPPDSKEWPIMYIRGVTGLREARARIAEMTAGHLDYLGEWHSHPRGASTQPSEDDAVVFGWICEVAVGDGRPAVMLIVGEGEARVFVAEFSPAIEPLALR